MKIRQLQLVHAKLSLQLLLPLVPLGALQQASLWIALCEECLQSLQGAL